ncbi:MAG TPA: hypothetical protein VG756_05170 [Pseudonocardiaceae bacterium]|jgi:hypothetical protein|nr:hypothetical protein [Pseudonocardiaceae bacterium]
MGGFRVDLGALTNASQGIDGMEEPMNIIDEIPEPHRTIIIEVLEDKDPQLLETLRTSAPPTFDVWLGVTDTMIDAMSEHYGPGHEPDETGKQIDNALGAFMLRWPSDALADS